MAEFKLDASSSQSSARAGTISINNKKIKTPVFMPVGTYGAVKTLSPGEISSIGYNLILANTYHIYLRPGIDILKKSNGLHNFMDWDGLILTDSGGFQIYSLKGLRKIQSDGATFQSHLDGTMHKLTPESIIDIQRIIGSDIMMMLDVCPSGDETLKKWEEAVDLTSKWAKQAMLYLKNSKGIYNKEQVLVPIVQGGTNKKLREKSANQLLELDASIYAIGGLAVGEPKENMLETVSWMDELLPKNKPRYLMGVGTPIDLVNNVSNGVDMFDCVMPTRNARNGQLFTKNGKINIRNSKYSDDHNPIDSKSKSPMSNQFTKSYLHHLFKTKEILGLRIASEHNLYFYYELMGKMRKEIINDSFVNWREKFISQYEGGENDE
tara:strand:- start:609 stop:1748 length:1140 start_codon:yes stop_codon:yes gene_type:complete